MDEITIKKIKELNLFTIFEGYEEKRTMHIFLTLTTERGKDHSVAVSTLDAKSWFLNATL